MIICSKGQLDVSNLSDTSIIGRFNEFLDLGMFEACRNHVMHVTRRMSLLLKRIQKGSGELKDDEPTMLLELQSILTDVQHGPAKGDGKESVGQQAVEPRTESLPVRDSNRQQAGTSMLSRGISAALDFLTGLRSTTFEEACGIRDNGREPTSAAGVSVAAVSLGAEEESILLQPAAKATRSGDQSSQTRFDGMRDLAGWSYVSDMRPVAAVCAPAAAWSQEPPRSSDWIVAQMERASGGHSDTQEDDRYSALMLMMPGARELLEFEREACNF